MDQPPARIEFQTSPPVIKQNVFRVCPDAPTKKPRNLDSYDEMVDQLVTQEAIEMRRAYGPDKTKWPEN